MLIPAPYYPAFDNDLTVKCALRPVPFHLDEQQPVGPQLQVRAAPRLVAWVCSSPDASA